MAEALKNLLGPAVVRAAAGHLDRAARRRGSQGASGWERGTFEAEALRGLERLEFKARALHIASALEASLPSEFSAAAQLIESALAPLQDEDERVDGPPPQSDAGLSGWIVWPLGEFVVRRGLEEPERALELLRALTQRFSAEWAIRPFLERHPDIGFRTLRRWTKDPSIHVRRLVSEGSRPRLPWGTQLRALIADPSPSFPLLESLQHDPSEYVRRSVANHLNDIGKDHPEVLADWVERYIEGAGPELRALLRHASRSLIKSGHARALGAFGLGAKFRGSVSLRCRPQRIRLGDTVEFQVALTSQSRSPQTLAIDYVVHHVKANGQTAPKVFKGWTITLEPGETRELQKRHAVRPISTRRYYSGRHQIEVQVTGKVLAGGEFRLEVP